MDGAKTKLTKFLNESFLPFGVKVLWSSMLWEYPREYVELINSDPAYGHPHVRCACGSDKVFNYGIPKNNGRYFMCRTCEASFKASVYQGEWNKIYRTCGAENPTYDYWLGKYDHLLKESRDLPIMDLGCGSGNDTIYLHQRGFKTVSCDYSDEALRRLSGLVNSATTVCFDMLDGLPFPSNTFKVIVANLSLHYFSWHDTEGVATEIRRILMKNGYLLCRVNSVGDTEHGAGQGTPIEENYCDVGGKRKRFFDEKQLEKLFRRWEILHCVEQRMMRTGKTKIFWEVVVQKR